MKVLVLVCLFVLAICNSFAGTFDITTIECQKSEDAPNMPNDPIPYFSNSKIKYLSFMDISIGYDECLYNPTDIQKLDNELGSTLMKDLTIAMGESSKFIVLCQSHSVGQSELNIIFEKDKKMYSKKGTISTANWNTKFYPPTLCKLN